MRRLRRNSSSTNAANTTPIKIASRTLAADAVISLAWSYQVLTLDPGRQFVADTALSFACTALTIATVLPPGC